MFLSLFSTYSCISMEKIKRFSATDRTKLHDGLETLEKDFRVVINTRYGYY